MKRLSTGIYRFRILLVHAAFVTQKKSNCILNSFLPLKTIRAVKVIMYSLLTFVLLFIYSDIDECRENEDLCYNGQCVDEEGGFRCICDFGYRENPQGTGCDGMFYF